MTAPAPTRAEEGRETGQDDLAARFALEERTALIGDLTDLQACLSVDGRAHSSEIVARAVVALTAVEAEVARLTAALAISEIAVRSLQARAAAFERVLKVRHPLTGKDASAWLVLADLAAQEGCDGEPYDTMQAVADALRAAFIGGDR